MEDKKFKVSDELYINKPLLTYLYKEFEHYLSNQTFWSENNIDVDQYINTKNEFSEVLDLMYIDPHNNYMNINEHRIISILIQDILCDNRKNVSPVRMTSFATMDSLMSPPNIKEKYDSYKVSNINNIRTFAPFFRIIVDNEKNNYYDENNDMFMNRIKNTTILALILNKYMMDDYIAYSSLLFATNHVKTSRNHNLFNSIPIHSKINDIFPNLVHNFNLVRNKYMELSNLKLEHGNDHLNSIIEQMYRSPNLHNGLNHYRSYLYTNIDRISSILTTENCKHAEEYLIHLRNQHNLIDYLFEFVENITNISPNLTTTNVLKNNSTLFTLQDLINIVTDLKSMSTRFTKCIMQLSLNLNQLIESPGFKKLISFQSTSDFNKDLRSGHMNIIFVINDYLKNPLEKLKQDFSFDVEVLNQLLNYKNDSIFRNFNYINKYDPFISLFIREESNVNDLTNDILFKLGKSLNLTREQLELFEANYNEISNSVNETVVTHLVDNKNKVDSPINYLSNNLHKKILDFSEPIMNEFNTVNGVLTKAQEISILNGIKELPFKILKGTNTVVNIEDRTVFREQLVKTLNLNLYSLGNHVNVPDAGSGLDYYINQGAIEAYTQFSMKDLEDMLGTLVMHDIKSKNGLSKKLIIDDEEFGITFSPSYYDSSSKIAKSKKNKAKIEPVRNGVVPGNFYKFKTRR